MKCLEVLPDLAFLQHAGACLRLIEFYIRLGEEGSACRENQLRRIAFTLLMEVRFRRPQGQAVNANRNPGGSANSELGILGSTSVLLTRR